MERPTINWGYRFFEYKNGEVALHPVVFNLHGEAIGFSTKPVGSPKESKEEVIKDLKLQLRDAVVNRETTFNYKEAIEKARKNAENMPEEKLDVLEEEKK